jgi:hypothetical protein
MRDVTIHKNMLLRRVGIEENCRLRQKYSICLLEEVVVLGYFADKAQVCRTLFCESVPFLIALQHDYGCLQSTYVAELKIEIKIHITRIIRCLLMFCVDFVPT